MTLAYSIRVAVPKVWIDTVRGGSVAEGHS
jgi:hypothetical protein